MNFNNYSTNKPLIIFDTDMDTDCDDAGALAMLYEYVKRGRAELLGIIVDVVSPYAAACCEALGNFYGINRPIGTIYADAYPSDQTDRMVRYRTLVSKMLSRQYNRIFAEQLQKKDNDYPSAVRTYRELLSRADDQSVTVLCVGLTTALCEALLSEPDDISVLSGKELFRQKVSKVVSMGYPNKTGDNFNWDMDGESTHCFLENCPVSIYVSGEGADIITGKFLNEQLPFNHPVRQIYNIYNRRSGGRSSWDLIATLYALEPETHMLKVESRDTCKFQVEESRSLWDSNGSRHDYEILINQSRETITAYLEDRLMGIF